MLKPNEIEKVSMALDEPMKSLENQIMQDIVRRIKINGEITRSADWQIYRLHELGMAKEDIKTAIQQSLNLSDEEIHDMYYNVVKSGYSHDKSVYTKAGISQIPLEKNEELQQLLNAVSGQTAGELKNISQSLGFAIKQPNGKLAFTEVGEYYQKTLDNAVMGIATGVFDYNTVIKKTIAEMTNSGLRTVDYSSGWSNRVDVAARRSIMTGLSQLTAKVNEQNAKKLDTDYFEISWHSGARPSHQVWQGKVYSHAELVSVCGLGEVDGLCGANCYHDYYPFIPGISERTYTDEQLEQMKAEENKPVTYNGKEYTKYEALQRQRKLETTMRAQRQQIKLLEEAGASEDDIINARCRYHGTSQDYTAFSKAMDLPQQRARVTADGLGNIGVGKTTGGTGKKSPIEIEKVGAKVVKGAEVVPDTAFTPAKTIEEAQEYAVNKLGFKSAQFGDTDLDVANMVNKTVLDIQERCPIVNEISVERIYADNPNAHHYMAMENSSLTKQGKLTGNSLDLGNYQCLSMNDLKRSIQHDANTGFHPKYSTVESTIWHEYGHAVGSKLEADAFLAQYPEMPGNSALFFKYNKESLANKWYKDVIATAKKDLKKEGYKFNINNVSRYSKKNVSEAFAEAFSEYYTSPQPSKESIAMMKAAGVDKSGKSGIIRAEKELSPRKSSGKIFSTDWNKIQTSEYSDKFKKLSADDKVSSAVETRAKWALNNRDGVQTEEIYAVNMRNGDEIGRITDQDYQSAIMRTPLFNSKLENADDLGDEILLIHNHPLGLPPSISDINALVGNKNISGITVGHNGSVYKYTRPSREISEDDWNIAMKHFKKYSDVTAMEKSLEVLGKKYGFSVEKL